MARYRCRAQAHGPHQIEFKIRYPLPVARRARYSFDLYIFLPAQLRVRRDGYASRRFVDDVVSYIRHTSPRVPLASLAEPDREDSPLARAERELARAAGDGSFDRDALVRELRTFCNAFRAAVRDERARVLIQASRPGTDDLGDRVRRMVDRVSATVDRVRRLPAAAERAGVDGRLLAATRWTDEWVSLNAEAELVRVWDGLGACQAPRELLDAVRTRIKDETVHRRDRGYPSVVRINDPAANARAMHHESLLKKWSQGALYMSSEQLAARGIAHIVGGVAAAAAMSFAVAATVLAERLFASYSVPWALMIVVAYIFKDRIKEVLKGSLGRLFPLLFFDRSGRLIDPDAGGSVGKTRETVRFVEPASCPRDISGARDAGGHPFVEILAPDDVIHYNRVVRLRRIDRTPPRGDARTITEILRIKTETWLREMDDPTSRMRAVWGSTVASVTVRRVYHVHVIAALSSSQEDRAVGHYLVTVSRDGIQGVEELGSNAPASARDVDVTAAEPKAAASTPR